MSLPPGDLLAVGRRGLADGNWTAARDAFRHLLESGDVGDTDESVQARLGLANSLWWLGELHESVAQRERAYAQFRRRGEQLNAALVAWQLSLDYRDGMANVAAGQGWLERTRRLIDDHGLEPLRAWVQLLEAHYVADPTESERLANAVLDTAGGSGDLDLELCALSQLGLALVDQGRVADGIRMLDEAMAGSLGGDARPDAVVFTSCNTLQACASSADVERAVEWLRAIDRFTQRFGSPFVQADCRIHYASLLVAIGDWEQAEEELASALRLSAGRLPALHGDALAMSATLRLARGEVEEAARLVDGLDERGGVAAVIGEIYVRQGRPETARSVVRRALAAVGEDRLQAAAMRELLGRALLDTGDTGSAREHGVALAELGAARACKVATAYGERLCGRVAATTDRPVDTRRHFDTALATFIELGMPYEAARTRLLLAQALRNEAPQAAADEARTALSVLDGLGARADADAARGLLRALGESAPRAVGRPGTGTLTRREEDVFALLGEGLSNPEIAERLYISRKTVEHHVARVRSKLALRNRAEAAAEAVRRGHLPGG